MPMIIDAGGKARKDNSLRRLFAAASAQYLNQLYEELKMLELKHASGDELDRLAELYGFARKYDLLLP